MLPDYPKTKNLIRDLVSERMEIPEQSDPFLSMLSRHKVFEGEKSQILRVEEEETQDIDFSTSQTKIEIDVRNIPNTSINDIIKRTDVAANELLQQQAAFVHKRLEEEVSKVGNSIYAKGTGFQPELFFEALEKISIDFDENGKPLWPTFFVGSAEMGKELIKSVQTDAANVKRMEELTEKKRMEWRARESNRKLVG